MFNLITSISDKFPVISFHCYQFISSLCKYQWTSIIIFFFVTHKFLLVFLLIFRRKRKKMCSRHYHDALVSITPPSPINLIIFDFFITQCCLSSVNEMMQDAINIAMNRRINEIITPSRIRSHHGSF